MNVTDGSNRRISAVVAKAAEVAYNRFDYNTVYDSKAHGAGILDAVSRGALRALRK